MCHNEGADESADPFTPSYAINGAYYQWGSKDQAASAPNSSGNDVTTITWITATPPDHFGDNTDGENVTAKSGYDPCPPGYRIPSFNEWDYLRQNNTKTNAGSWTNSSTGWAGSKFGEGLYLPAAGYRHVNGGTLSHRGSGGIYRSTRKLGTSYAYYLYFTSSGRYMSYNYRTIGYSERCIVE
jgi:uncharacterized protein (TIGR02145 family)